MAVHRLGAGCSCGLGFGEAEVRLHLGQRAAGTGLAVKAIQPQQASAPDLQSGWRKGPRSPSSPDARCSARSRSPPVPGANAAPWLGEGSGSRTARRARVLPAPGPRSCRCPWERRKRQQQSSGQALRPEKSPCVPRSIICSIASPKLFLKPGGSH